MYKRTSFNKRLFWKFNFPSSYEVFLQKKGIKRCWDFSSKIKTPKTYHMVEFSTSIIYILFSGGHS